MSRGPGQASRTGEVPLVSVVMATYEAADTLPAALESVDAQTLEDRELVVVDGGSSDGTVALLEEAGDRVDRWISEPDEGVYDAWNKGIRRSRGRWVCFLGADDRFHGPQVLERMAPELAQADEEGVRLVYGRVRLVDEQGRPYWDRGAPWAELRQGFLDGVMGFYHTGTFHRRDLFRERGLFDPSYRIVGDYELMLRELKERPAAFADTVTVEMRAGGQSADFGNRLETLGEIQRARREQDLRRWSPRLFWRLARALCLQPAYRLLGPRRFRDLKRWVRRHRPNV